jgi:ATP-dependent 26S proteasome regulatory subunit
MSDDSSEDDVARHHKRRREAMESDKVTLGTLLELMDGLVEFPGRMIIITTNHPEALDPALLRPGRIDMHIHFSKLRAIDIANIYKVWTGFQLSDADIARIPNEVFTQAELSQLIFKYEFKPEQLLEFLYSYSGDSLSSNIVERIKED